MYAKVCCNLLEQCACYSMHAVEIVLQCPPRRLRADYGRFCSLNRGWRKADDAGIDVHAIVTMMVLSIFS